MARVKPEPDSLGIGAARMSIRFADGRTAEEQVTAARGTPENPHDEAEAKFRRLAEVVLPAERVTRFMTALPRAGRSSRRVRRWPRWRPGEGSMPRMTGWGWGGGAAEAPPDS
jgi:hypothetical protein